MLAEAEACFRKAVELDADVHYNIGHVLLRMEDDERGIAEMKRYLEREPNGPKAELARGMIENPRRAREAFAPALSFTTIDGEYKTLEDLRGQVVLLDFWASWCQPCLMVVDDLERIAKKYAKDGLVVLSVSADHDEATWREFVERNELAGLHTYDAKRAIAAALSVRVFPTYIVVDHEGIMRSRMQGSRDVQDGTLESAIKRALKARAAAGAVRSL